MKNLEYLEKKIKQIEESVISANTSLLELELVPLFLNLKKLISTKNLEPSTEIYQRSYAILDQKFREFKELLRSLDNQNNFIQYLNQKPSDEEILCLMKECWLEPFLISTISLDFMVESHKKLIKRHFEPIIIKHLELREKQEDFLLEVPEKTFVENMEFFYEQIVNILPCSFNEVFENEQDQITIYEKFVYLLHLLQLGRIKYQKETKTLYK